MVIETMNFKKVVISPYATGGIDGQHRLEAYNGYVGDDDEPAAVFEVDTVAIQGFDLTLPAVDAEVGEIVVEGETRRIGVEFSRGYGSSGSAEDTEVTANLVDTTDDAGADVTVGIEQI